MMLIDEAWHLISRPETGEYANDLARRARHLGLALIVMSQQLSDFDTEHGVALVGNSVPAAAAGPEPAGDPVHRRDRRALRARGHRAAAAEDRQGPPRADAVAERHPRARQGHAAGRPDRVLGVHLGPDRGRRSARPRSPATTATCGRRSHSSPRAAPARTATGKATRCEQHRPARTERAPLAEQPRAVTRTAMSVISRQPPVPPGSSNGATTMRPSPASRAAVRCSRSAGSRRRRRQHARLPDRARGRPARRPAGARRRHGRAERRVSRYAGVEVPRSLTEAAEHVDAGLPAGQLLRTARRPARPGHRTRAHPHVLAGGRGAAARARARALHADRDRLRHARPRGRPDRARERHARRVGAARDRRRRERGRRVLDAIAPHRRAESSSSRATSRATAEGRCASCEIGQTPARPLVLFPNVPSSPQATRTQR